MAFLSTISDILVILMAIVVILIYSYVYFSVKHIRKDVIQLRDGANNFIKAGAVTYSKMGDTMSELRSRMDEFLSEEPSQHLAKSYIMTLATLGAKDLKDYDSEARGRIIMAKNGAQSIIKGGVKDAISSGMMGGGSPGAGPGAGPGIGLNPMEMLGGLQGNPAGLLQTFQQMDNSPLTPAQAPVQNNGHRGVTESNKGW